jgi:hypothetical protein
MPTRSKTVPPSVPATQPAATPGSSPTTEGRAKLAAIYARSAQRNPDSIAVQVAACREAAAQDGYVVPDEPDFQYIDDGFGGHDADRPSFKALLELVATGAAPFERLYVKDPSRIERSTDLRRLYYFEVLLAESGAPIHYVGEAGPSYSCDVPPAWAGYRACGPTRAQAEQDRGASAAATRTRAEYAPDRLRALATVPRCEHQLAGAASR